MFVDFWADWCAACNVMDAEVYTQPSVIKAFEERVIGRASISICSRIWRASINVPALPFLIFTNSYGTPLVYHRGLLEADDLTRGPGGDAAAGGDQPARSRRAGRQEQLRQPAGADAPRRRLLRVEQQLLRPRLEAPRRQGRRRPRESILYDMALNSLELQDADGGGFLEKMLKDFPKSPRKPSLLLALGRATPSTRRRTWPDSLWRPWSTSPADAVAADALVLLKSL